MKHERLGAAEAATDCASELWILALRTNTWVLRFAQDDTVKQYDKVVIVGLVGDPHGRQIVFFFFQALGLRLVDAEGFLV